MHIVNAYHQNLQEYQYINLVENDQLTCIELEDVSPNELTSKWKTVKYPTKVKYIITLDQDTELTLNSAFKMIGAMDHILNKPEIDNNIVVNGHALMQPRVGIGLLEVRRSLFTKIYSGLGGTDSYVNAIFDVYQDNFDEGIFTGKGIYDLNVFSKISSVIYVLKLPKCW